MLQIDRALVSLELIGEKFCCNLEACKGACCVSGDSGAPLEEEEAEHLRVLFAQIRPYLRHEGIKAIEESGTSVIDIENDRVTPLIDGKECAYVVFENGIARCGIEMAFLNNAIPFRKPVSCYLYPVRIKKYSQYEAVNYDRWDICHPARIKGREMDLSVFRFVRDALIARYGEKWFRLLETSAENLKIERFSEDTP